MDQFIMSEFSHTFISSQNVKLQQAQKRMISIQQFLFYIAFDLGIILVSFVIWYFLWVRLGILEIKNITNNLILKVDSTLSFRQFMHCLKSALKNISNLNCYLIRTTGFEAYTYIYFIRRMLHLMVILTIGDICIWIPYQLYFLKRQQFSLVTMSSQGNDVFRTYYMLGVCMIILYGLHNMREYLQLHLRYVLYHANPKESLLNNLKSKTVHIHFVSDKIQTSDQIRQKIIEGLQIQDRILAVRHIPNYSQRLDVYYRQQITEVIRQLDPQTFHCFWKLMKYQEYNKIQSQIQQDWEKAHSFQKEQRNQQVSIKSYYIVFQSLKTAEKLVNQFQTSKAIADFLEQFGYNYDTTLDDYSGKAVIAKWAQQPNDITWINMKSHQAKICRFITFNIICLMLLVISFFLIAFTTNGQLAFINLPKALAPFFVIIMNSIIRFLICKTTEWQNKILRSETMIKQFKVVSLYFLINVVLGSIVRDTINVLDILQSGWGFIQLFGLIYRKVDGYFYYLFILNQSAITFFVMLVKPGEMFLDYYEVRAYFEKVKRVKYKSWYGLNDCFRFGYYYSYSYIILGVIILFSATCPLIHLCGLIFFFSRLHLDGYQLMCHHKNQQTASHMRLINSVIFYIQCLVILCLFLTAMTMVSTFNGKGLVLYIAIALIVYYMYWQSSQQNFLVDHISDQQLSNADLKPIIRKWKELYSHPIQLLEKDRHRII